jgi:predicted nucleotidyltransferase
MQTVPEPLLDEVVRRLVAEFDPDQVILFGSHAWGEPHEESDLDLLVVAPESDERPTRRATRAHRCLRGLAAPMDLIVRTRDEFHRSAGVPGSLEALILERGRVLYGRGEAGVRPGLASQGVP